MHDWMLAKIHNRKQDGKRRHKGGGRRIAAVWLLYLLMLIITACGAGQAGTAQDPGEGKSSGGSTEALSAVNELPEDGIITKEQFETVAGEDMEISFHGTDASGIEYTWTMDAAQIQNPMDQNLKITFTSDGLDDVKAQANDANDALMLTMNGEGLICVPTLTITLPEAWQSDTGLLLKEQGGSLARMSDVTIEAAASESTTSETGEAAETAEADTQAAADTESASAPLPGTTTLTMQVTSLNGDCYIVGGITGVQNKGAAAANGDTTETAEDTTAETSKGDTQTASSDTSTSKGSTESSSSSSDRKSSSGDVSNDVKSDDSTTSHTCTISISCATILDHMDDLTDGKEEFVPADGQILAPSTVEFEEGESVHDVLKRVCKEADIHMESSYTPAYNSAYVEGINQLYEFDCGELSGWMYKVNGWFPNYGCSKYTVSDGDEIVWVYTCDLGKDVGDNSSWN